MKYLKYINFSGFGSSIFLASSAALAQGADNLIPCGIGLNKSIIVETETFSQDGRSLGSKRYEEISVNEQHSVFENEVSGQREIYNWSGGPTTIDERVFALGFLPIRYEEVDKPASLGLPRKEEYEYSFEDDLLDELDIDLSNITAGLKGMNLGIALETSLLVRGQEPVASIFGFKYDRSEKLGAVEKRQDGFECSVSAEFWSITTALSLKAGPLDGVYNYVEREVLIISGRLIITTQRRELRKDQMYLARNLNEEIRSIMIVER